MPIFHSHRCLQARRIQGVIQRLFREPQAHRCRTQHSLCILSGGAIQVFFIDHFCEQTQVIDTFCRKELPGQQQLRCNRRAHRTWQKITATHIATGQTNIQISRVHAKICTGHAQVSRECQTKPSSASRTLKRSDNGLRAASHGRIIWTAGSPTTQQVFAASVTCWDL
ncbi:MAG: hypothetical protein ACI8RN_001711 [Glaciecola sp.]|jgi:hypothetical protein